MLVSIVGSQRTSERNIMEVLKILTSLFASVVSSSSHHLLPFHTDGLFFCLHESVSSINLKGFDAVFTLETLKPSSSLVPASSSVGQSANMQNLSVNE